MAHLYQHLMVILVTYVFFSEGAPQATDLETPSTKFTHGCKAVPSQKDFSLKDFQGGWYVGYHFNMKLPPCQYILLQATSSGEVSISMSMIISANSSFLATGKGLIADEKNPGSMIWEWKFLPSTLETVTVIDTDYTNYAVVVICVDGKRSGILWTRNFNVDPIYIERAQRSLAPFLTLPDKTEVQKECNKIVNRNMSKVFLDELFQTTVDIISTFNILRLGSLQ